MLKIEKVSGNEILDSRGTPTVLAKVVLSDGTVGVGSSPSGASTGKFEAFELRDKDPDRFNGKGVLKAVGSINTEISSLISGRKLCDLAEIDNVMISLDGTCDKSRLGANAILAVSIAYANALAKSEGIPLYYLFGGDKATNLPTPMLNILNGGAHADNNLDIQEFMIVPTGAFTFKTALRQSTEVFHTLKGILRSKGLSTSVGDEGGFAPDLSSDLEAIDLILEAIEKAGYKPEKDFMIALDAAASEWKTDKTGIYRKPKSKEIFTSDELVLSWKELCLKYPIISIEDGLDEEDWQGWQRLTKSLGDRVQLVGDDLFVTNTKRLEKGIESCCANSILIKPNQIGTLTETVNAIRLAQKKGYRAIASHRSGETIDTTITDLAVGLSTNQIKTGAPSRGERIAKYNRLLEISEELGERAIYLGKEAF